MIEIKVREFLIKKLNVDVFLEYPTDKNIDDFILIEKVGSSRENRLDSATIAIQSYGEDMYKAATLNERVKQVMEDLANDIKIGSVSLNSDYNFTDIEMKRYRYQAVFDIYYYN